MEKAALIVLNLMLANLMYAQMVLHDPISARTFNTQKYSEIKGTPFLWDKWIKGTVITEKGTYNNLELKLDVYTNTLYFSRDGEAFEFQDHVTGFILKPNEKDSSSFKNYKKGISVKDIKADQYLQILSEGNLSIYKHDSRLLSEINEINRGVVKSFTPTIKYYTVKNKEWKQIKWNKKELLELMSDQKEKVQAYIIENHLELKNDTDWIKVLTFYNSL